MSALKLTAAKLELLRAVEAGQVTGYPQGPGQPVDYYWQSDPNRLSRMVTGRLVAMFPAGWVRRGADRWSAAASPFMAPFAVELTDEGKRVLAEHGGGDAA